MVISLLSVYLLSTTELYQLVKIPCLVQHFIEHREQDRNISLWRFLCMHYAGDDIKDADYDRDMKLPFKTHDGCTTAGISVFTPNNFSTLIQRPVCFEPKAFPMQDVAFTSASFLSAIWQPPRNC